MAIQVFSWLSKRGSQIYKNCNKTEPNNIILPGAISKVQICKICEMVPKQHQGCQLLSKFFDNMDYIIISQCHTIQAQLFQVLATVRNKADCRPT